MVSPQIEQNSEHSIWTTFRHVAVHLSGYCSLWFTQQSCRRGTFKSPAVTMCFVTNGLTVQQKQADCTTKITSENLRFEDPSCDAIDECQAVSQIPETWPHEALVKSWSFWMRCQDNKRNYEVLSGRHVDDAMQVLIWKYTHTHTQLRQCMLDQLVWPYLTAVI